MEWNVENNNLTRDFELSNFVEAVHFVINIVPLAEEMNHHPDVLIYGYKHVKVMLFTHSLNSITDKDYTLAKKIDEIWQKYIEGI
ncbi:MAG TPA: 4a-hydroxytetrahydrobiopterin dehydratase [Bacteroidales bacterium]|jgi:4a-hydroxytetrahydrobiopterin dehydratase